MIEKIDQLLYDIVFREVKKRELLRGKRIDRNAWITSKLNNCNHQGCHESLTRGHLIPYYKVRKL